MAITSRTVSPGDDLYDLASQYYGDPLGWTLIARANGLTDALIQTDSTLIIPAYNAAQANSGILASQ